VAICTRIHSSEKKVSEKIEKPHTSPQKVFEPGVNLGELMNKREAEEKLKRQKEKENDKPQ
jgi:hypothetical protein